MDIKQAVALAEEAARAGDGWEAVKHLFYPEVLGRVTGRLRREWPWITKAQIEDATAEAYVALYEEIRSGASPRSPLAWLAGVAYRKAADAMRRTEREDITDPTRLPAPAEVDPDAAARSQAAFVEFERLIERLTPDGVKRVMEVVVEAYRTGTYVLPNKVIAEILGEDAENVKKWRQRGFEKLGRLARETGLVGADFRLNELVLDPADEDHDDEEEL